MENRNTHNLLIDIKDLTWGYENSPSMMFHKFNFALYKNDFCVIMGKSGTGKSTLVKFLIGQIKSPPKTIYHKMEDMSKYSSNEIQIYRRKIGIVFQDYKLIDNLTTKENIIYPLELYGIGQSTITNKFNRIKSKLNLHDIEKTKIKFLSSGEKQKIAIARALINEPEFIIADEPTGNLDWEHTQQIADILIESNRTGNTILLITHDIHLLEYLKHKHKINIHNM